MLSEGIMVYTDCVLCRPDLILSKIRDREEVWLQQLQKMVITLGYIFLLFAQSWLHCGWIITLLDLK
jgi:hypothetical protein